LKPGDVVVGILVGAQETKVLQAVVIASATYLAERPDAVVGILTTKLPKAPATTDTPSWTGERPDFARSRASGHMC
jgi:hypothetical protein